MGKIIVLLALISIFLVAGCDYEKDGELIPTGVGLPSGINEQSINSNNNNNNNIDESQERDDNEKEIENTTDITEEEEVILGVKDDVDNQSGIEYKKVEIEYNKGYEIENETKNEIDEEEIAVEIGYLVDVDKEGKKEPKYCFMIEDIYKNLTYNNNYLKGYVDTIEICKSDNGKEKFIMHNSYKRNMMDSGFTKIYDSNLVELCWYGAFGMTNCEEEIENINYEDCEEVCGYGSQECRELIKGQKYECPVLEKITFKGNCSEVDNKKNYYVKGNSSYIEGNYTVFDYCLNSSRFHTEETEECEGEDCLLIETYCSPAYVDYSDTVSLKELNRINLEKYKCQFGCKDGACITE